MTPLHGLDHETCLRLMCEAPVTLLTKDITDWAENASHGSVFKINSKLHVLALDFNQFHF